MMAKFQESAELLAGQNRVLELIARGEPLPIVLDSLLGVIQSQCPGMPCSILVLDPDGIHVRHAAARDLPDAFMRGVDGQSIGPRAGSCGTAAFRREPVIVEDIATDPLWDDYREMANAAELRACWSTPILDAEHRVLGTFAMYFREPGPPDAHHWRLIDVTTHIAAIAITRHQKVEALRSSEERLRLALSGGNVDIWQYDVAAGSLHWYGSLKTILGWPDIESLPLQSFIDAIHPVDRENMRAALRELLAHGASHNFEFRIIYPDGSLHWYAFQGRAVSDAAGKALRVCGVALDITERKNAAEEIAKREAQLIEAQRIARMGSYEWDLQSNTVRRSEELCRVFGLRPDEFEPTYEGYLARVHPEDRPRTKAIIDRAFELRQPFDFEERIVRPDGSIRMLHSQGRWTPDDQGRPIKLVGICQDITERKQVERRIQALTARLINAHEEERTRLARELHDDLSQQIAALSIPASNLKKGIAPADEEARAQSGRMQQKLFHLAESVRQLSHSLHPAMLEYSGLGAALQSYCTEFGTLTGMEISFCSKGSFEHLPAPAALALYRMTQEALQNVLKHAQVKRARVEIEGSAESVGLTVSDEGVGIDQSVASSSPGLGLVSIRERARLIGGVVKMESRQGHGTTLHVVVPIERDEVTAMNGR